MKRQVCVAAMVMAIGMVMNAASTAWAQQSPSADSTLKVTPYGTIYFNFFD